MFLKGGEEGFSTSGVGLWFISKEEGKQENLGRMVRSGVMLEFSGGEKISPGSTVVSTEDAEIGLNFLVSSFSLSIGLRVVCSRESDIIVEEAG